MIDRMEQFIDQVAQGFIACGLWCDVADIDILEDGTVTEAPTDGSFDESWSDLNFRPDELTQAAYEDIHSHVEEFVTCNAWALVVALSTAGYALDGGQVGHDLWLTRNGHGAGFWDRGLGQVGDVLTEACKPYGGCHFFHEADGSSYGAIGFEG